MTQGVRTTELTEEIVRHLEPRLRDDDALECEAIGMTCAQALRRSFEHSVESYLVEIDGEVVAFWGFGVSSHLGACAYPWLLTTPAIEKYKFRFARGSRRVVYYILSKYPRLQTMVDCRYTDAITWLEWLGFDAYPQAVRLGPERVPFLIMNMQTEVLGERGAWVH